MKKTCTKTVIAQLEQLLNPLGFERNNTTWSRETNFIWDVIDLQVDRAGDMITVNAGVLDVDVYSMLWGYPPPKPIEQTLCTVGIRIGEIIDGKDKWWTLSNENSIDEIYRSTVNHVLPFLEKMHSRNAMMKWLIDHEVSKKRYPPPILNLAILNSFLGDPSQTKKILDDLQKKSIGPWKIRVAEVAARLNQ
jgi:hypothetical protein